MYKILHNNLIIDVIKELKFVRYISTIKKIIPTSAISAHGIQGSKPCVYYALRGVDIPSEKSHWKVITYEPINEVEYNLLSKALNTESKIVANSYLLNKTREAKVNELKEKCEQCIFEGIELVLSDNLSHKFSLTLEDQINLNTIKLNIQNGIERHIYHENNKLCKLYSNLDMLKIIEAAEAHRTYHTTYFNLLKSCIYNMNELNHIKSIQYGDSLDNFDIDPELLNLL